MQPVTSPVFPVPSRFRLHQVGGHRAWPQDASRVLEARLFRHHRSLVLVHCLTTYDHRLFSAWTKPIKQEYLDWTPLNPAGLDISRTWDDACRRLRRSLGTARARSRKPLHLLTRPWAAWADYQESPAWVRRRVVVCTLLALRKPECRRFARLALGYALASTWSPAILGRSTAQAV